MTSLRMSTSSRRLGLRQMHSWKESKMKRQKMNVFPLRLTTQQMDGLIIKRDCQLSARHLYQARSELSISDGLLLKGDRIIIPATLPRKKSWVAFIKDTLASLSVVREPPQACGGQESAKTLVT